MDEWVCPNCGYPYIACDRKGWFCLNGRCGRFDIPIHPQPTTTQTGDT